MTAVFACASEAHSTAKGTCIGQDERLQTMTTTSMFCILSADLGDMPFNEMLALSRSLHVH